jgi:hypothetical protein
LQAALQTANGSEWGSRRRELQWQHGLQHGQRGQHLFAGSSSRREWATWASSVRYVEENGVRRITEFWNVSRGQMYKIDVQAAEDNHGWWRWQHVPDESEPEYGSQQGQQAAEAQQESNQQEEEGQQAATEAHA